MATGERQKWARKMVGARLRHLRIQRNLRQNVAAAAIGSSITKISRMESGLVQYRRQDLLTLLTLYGVDDPHQQEALLSVALGHRDPGWWDGHDVHLEETVVWAHEQAADLICMYQPHLVPELLRTQEYARTAHQAGRYPPPLASATDTSVTHLLHRQEALRVRGTKLWAVIDEPVLWRPLRGDVDMHAQQLDTLADAGQALRVTIQIVPLNSPYLPSSEPFTIVHPFGKPPVIVLHRHAGDEIKQLADVDHYGVLFDQLTAAACDSDDTPRLLARIRDHVVALHRNPPRTLEGVPV